MNHLNSFSSLYALLVIFKIRNKLELNRFLYVFFFFSYNAKDLFMYTHIFLVYLGMTFRGVFSSIISPFPLLKLLIGSRNAMYNAKNWKWFIDIHCVQNAREDKKTFTVDREIRKSANTCKWMNEWKACWGKGWKKLQSCMLAQLIGHMCNRCHLSAAIVYIASLFLMVLFIHIHNWSNCRRKSFYTVLN